MFDWRYWRDREPQNQFHQTSRLLSDTETASFFGVLWMVLACSCSTNFRILLLHSEHIRPPIDRGPREAPEWHEHGTWWIHPFNTQLFRLGLRSHLVSQLRCQWQGTPHADSRCVCSVLGVPFLYLFVGWESVSHVSLCFILSPSIPGWRHANAAVGDGTYFERQALRAERGAAKNLALTIMF